jgi:ABC-type lipopolysaccharide export system ATPase subunit
MIHTMEADGIRFEFGLRKILSDIYIKCQTGKITGLLGRNGQGKTCLMNIIYGSMGNVDKSDFLMNLIYGTMRNVDKSVRFDNIVIPQPFKNSRLLLYLPQFNFIPKHLTLKRIFLDFDIEFSEFEKDFPEYKIGCTTTLENLSSGQRRLIEIYLIIKSPTQFVMLDEPFTHIMPHHIDIIQNIIMKEKEKKGFLITDHMYQSIINIADSLYILKDGKTHFVKTIHDIEALGYIRP